MGRVAVLIEDTPEAFVVTAHGECQCIVEDPAPAFPIADGESLITAVTFGELPQVLGS